MRDHSNRFLISALLIVGLSTGCGGKKNKSDEDGNANNSSNQKSNSDPQPKKNSNPKVENKQPPGDSSDNLVAKAKLPASFPTDVPRAPSMRCQSVTRVRDNFMVTFYAAKVSISDLVDHFKTSMAKEGWKEDADMVKENNAILAYSKGKRRCGISISNVIVGPNGKKMDNTRLITIQTPAQ